MATLTSLQAADTYPLAKPAIAGVVCASVGTLSITANPTIADIWQLCRVPAYSTILGGMLYSGDLDTNAAETLNLSLGWAANGEDAASVAGLGAFGVMGTDVVAGIKAENGYQYPLGGDIITGGPKTFNRETIIQATVVAAAATFAAGTICCVVYYRNKDF
jgi:hypothetical protein